nr:MAG TPA: hypothetical protein [Caudoviricetes sp.]
MRQVLVIFWDMEIIQLILVVMFITVLVDRVLLFQTMVLRLQHPKLKLWRSYLEGMFSLKDLSGKNGIKRQRMRKIGFYLIKLAKNHRVKNL